MRTTIVLPDDLVMKAKRRAIETKSALTKLLIDGLRHQLQARLPARELPTSVATGGLCKGADWQNPDEPRTPTEWPR